MLSLLLAVSASPGLSAPSISVSYPKTIMGQFSGRIYVFVSKDPSMEPRLGPDWRNPGPVIAVDVKQTKADTDIVIDDSVSLGEGGQLRTLPPGEYAFQAMIDRNPASPRVGDGDGNLYSAPVRAHIGSNTDPVKLVCDQYIDEPSVHTTGTVKVLELESTLLSNAQRRSVIWRAVVVLPSEYSSQPNRKFPVLVDIPDRGDSYANYPNRDSNQAAYRDGKPFIYLRLDPESASGYHYMADSANNGPYAKALVEEFLPYAAKQYHGDLGHVVLSGIGAGGWSALWLQVTHPDAFAGCWAMDPDSIDFHSIRGLNLYSDANVLRLDTPGANGTTLRPWTRDLGESWATHSDLEKVLRGFWITGWESDFSPKSKNGKPTPLFDRTTGQIDPAVAKAWEAFDIDAYVKANWATLGNQLAGKLHIYGVESDPAFRSVAISRFSTELAQLGGDPGNAFVQKPADVGSEGGLASPARIARAEAAAAYPRG